MTVNNQLPTQKDLKEIFAIFAKAGDEAILNAEQKYTKFIKELEKFREIGAALTPQQVEEVDMMEAAAKFMRSIIDHSREELELAKAQFEATQQPLQ